LARIFKTEPSPDSVARLWEIFMQLPVLYIIDTACIGYAELGLRNGPASIRLSVSFTRPHSAAASLLLWDRRAGDIDRFLPGPQQQPRHRKCRQCHVVS